jgi:hypothetical protein
MLDGKPIVLLYASAFAAKWDKTLIDYTKAQFARDFGQRVPWIAPQDSWAVKADGICAWGGALAFRNPGIGELGPGYDHSAVKGRAPLVRDREGGKFYEASWQKFLGRPSNFVMVETWDEFHEGTDIADSKEYGRQYIELTRKYSDRLKSGWKPPRPTGKFSSANTVSVQLAATNTEGGLRQVDCEDGQTTVVTEANRAALRVKPFQQSARYLYFIVDDSFKWADSMDLVLEVNYFDAAIGTLRVDFDGSDPAAPFSGAYSRSPTSVVLTGDKSWKTARFDLPGARFLNSENGGADFRLVGETTELNVGAVTLSRRLR